ncbi:hypothetical protein, partial [Klebsiella quasipneumoniae]|uniref:hypothetical protein n=1 Tax=Klebsiella quasipneumoniae TaxID=1463165 RepID=UPI00344CB739
RLIIAAGVGTARSWQSMTTTYILRNVKDEQFTILLDYQKGLAPTSECVCTAGKESIKATEELAAGLRYSITLPAKGTITVTITEKYLASEEFE